MTSAPYRGIERRLRTLEHQVRARVGAAPGDDLLVQAKVLFWWCSESELQELENVLAPHSDPLPGEAKLLQALLVAAARRDAREAPPS